MNSYKIEYTSLRKGLNGRKGSKVVQAESIECVWGIVEEWNENSDSTFTEVQSITKV